MMSATTPSTTRSAIPEVRRPVDPGMPALIRSLPPVPAPAPEVALLPNLLLPGASHAGAATLSTELARHPQVCLAAERGSGRFLPLRYGRAVDFHPHDYDRAFAGWAGQSYRVETSPGYFDGGRPMVDTLAERLPDLRVVVLLTDPANRLWTGYTDKLARRRLPHAISFETFVDRCLALRANGADRFEGNRHFRTLSGGFYVEHLPHWLDTFGDRLRLVFTEDLHADPAAGLLDLVQWLGLDPAQLGPGREDGEEYPVPPEVAPGRLRWPVLQRTSAWWGRPDAGGAARLPRQSERTRARVRSLYSGANAELAAMLRERGWTALPGWLTDPEL
jgi:hypothetical protein